MIHEATCTAPVNIAVVKYWGKRSTSLILPTNSSLSVTLSQDHLRSLTTARAVEGASAEEEGKDRLWLNGVEEEIKEGGRTETCLKELRGLRAEKEATDSSLPKIAALPLRIASENNFPTAAGLASSASGLSALVFTVSTLYGLAAPETMSSLSRIARQGSGSACRSMFGGYVGWEQGKEEDGRDSVAYQVADVDHWPEMRALVLVVSDKKKGTSSTSGMQATVATSPLLQHRIKEVVPSRMARMEEAIKGKDFDLFAKETMADSNSFHAVCLDTTPPIFYMNDVSRAAIAVVEELNRSSIAAGGKRVAAYTFDAGPNAVIYTLSKDVSQVLSLLLRYFPQSTPLSDPWGLSPLPTGEEPLPFEGFNEKVVQPRDKGEVSRFILTQVGGGPRVLDTEKEGLLGKEGTPK